MDFLDTSTPHVVSPVIKIFASTFSMLVSINETLKSIGIKRIVRKEIRCVFFASVRAWEVTHESKPIKITDLVVWFAGWLEEDYQLVKTSETSQKMTMWYDKVFDVFFRRWSSEHLIIWCLLAVCPMRSSNEEHGTSKSNCNIPFLRFCTINALNDNI